MSLATAKLPSDPAALRAFARALQAEFGDLQTTTARELAARDAELHAKTLHIEKLKLQLALLRNARFGRSSEKLDRDIEQLELLIGDLEEGHADAELRQDAVAAAAKAEPSRDTTRPVPARRSFPEHLERVPVEHPAACVCPACGGTNLTVVGTDEREVLEYVPSHFRVLVHRRPKVSCRSCETMTQPPMPALPIERGTPGPGLLAHVLVSKYCDHLPLHRQAAIYARDGVELDRSTLADWVGKMAYHLRPLADAIAAYVRAGPVLHADDTPVPVLDPGRGRTRTGRLWVAVRDERPWGSTAPPAVYYRYSPDRKAERAASLLLGSNGHLHADGYSGFAGLYRPDPITGRVQFEEVACWAHARRKLHEVHLATQSVAAKGLLEDIGELFAIEAAVRGRSAEDRRAARVDQAVPRLERLCERLEHTLSSISRKSSLAEAIRYALIRWPALTRYAGDGRLEMSNNAAERAIRPLAVGRKNWVFAGSDTGGDRAAVMYTLVETAKLSGVDPEAYLRHVINRIADHPARRLDELLPWNVNL